MRVDNCIASCQTRLANSTCLCLYRPMLCETHMVSFLKHHSPKTRESFCSAHPRVSGAREECCNPATTNRRVFGQDLKGTSKAWSLKRQHRSLDAVYTAAAQSSEALQAQKPQPRNTGNWQKLQSLHSNGTPVPVVLEKVNRKGAIFELHGTQGFIPYSFMDFTRLPSDHDGMALEYLVNKTLTVKLIRVSEEESLLVASELAYLLQQLAENLEEGDIVEGVVSQCKDFGAFVRLGSGKTLQGVEGLIHISELSWNKVFTPEAVVQPGMVVRCKVLTADPVQGKINLSLKRMEPDPLEERLDTVLDALGAEKVVVTPTKLPSSIEDVVQSLERQPEVTSVSVGRQAEEKRAVSQDLEIWMSKAEVEGGFALVARAGRLVQEICVQTSMPKDRLRELADRVLQDLSNR